MLKILIPASDGIEQWDEEKQVFVYTGATKEQILELEHSLVSLSKWESKWCKPFISNKEKTFEETIDYIKCMTINRVAETGIYSRLSDNHIIQVNEYIAAPMTASTVREVKSGGGRREQITSELIYYWMIALNIPFECQKWHLNRLLMLIKICNAKNQPPKKIGKNALLRRNAELNAARREQYKSKG